MTPNFKDAGVVGPIATYNPYVDTANWPKLQCFDQRIAHKYPFRWNLKSGWSRNNFGAI